MPTLKAGDLADVVSTSTKFFWHVLNADRTIGDKKEQGKNYSLLNVCPG